MSTTNERATWKWAGAPSLNWVPLASMLASASLTVPRTIADPKPPARFGHRKPRVPPTTSVSQRATAPPIERRSSVRLDSPAGRPRRNAASVSRVRARGSSAGGRCQLPIACLDSSSIIRQLGVDRAVELADRGGEDWRSLTLDAQDRYYGLAKEETG